MEKQEITFTKDDNKNSATLEDEDGNVIGKCYGMKEEFWQDAKTMPTKKQIDDLNDMVI